MDTHPRAWVLICGSLYLAGHVLAENAKRGHEKTPPQGAAFLRSRLKSVTKRIDPVFQLALRQSADFVAVTSPSLNSIMGMPHTPYCCGTGVIVDIQLGDGDLAVHLRRLSAGAMVLHGPHHSAQVNQDRLGRLQHVGRKTVITHSDCRHLKLHYHFWDRQTLPEWPKLTVEIGIWGVKVAWKSHGFTKAPCQIARITAPLSESRRHAHQAQSIGPHQIAFHRPVGIKPGNQIAVAAQLVEVGRCHAGNVGRRRPVVL